MTRARGPRRPGGTAAINRRRPWIAGAVGLAVISLTVLTALGLGRASLHAAEQDRINERASLSARTLKYFDSTYSPSTLESAAASVVFLPGYTTANERLIREFSTTSTGDTVLAVLLDPADGSPLASTTAHVTVPSPSDFGPAWTDARHGVAANSGAFMFHGTTAWATLAPVGGPKPWAVIAVVQESRHSSAQTFISQLGSLGSGRNGGMYLIDRTGRAIFAWDPAQLGQMIVSPAALAALPTDRRVVLTTGDGDAQLTTIYRRSDSGMSILFRQPTSQLFADLRRQQRTRDLTLVAVLLTAVFCLMVASLLRVRTVRRAQAQLDALLENSRDLMFVFDADGAITYGTPSVAEVLGYPQERCAGLTVEQVTHPQDVERLTHLLQHPGDLRALLDVRLGTAESGYRWFDIEASDLSADRALRGTLLTCHNVGERKELQDELTEQARHDSLTGLPNRRVLIGTLADALRGTGETRAAGPAGRAALLFVDLDRFKQVNDRYGHEYGDQVLRTVSERMLSLVRRGDVVCRFGGDEFGIVLIGADEAVAREVAERVVAAVGEPIVIQPGTGADGATHETVAAPQLGLIGERTGRLADDLLASAAPVQVQVGASVGVVVSAPGLEDPETLLRVADAAMYEAKARGRGQAMMAQEPGRAGSGLAVAPAMAGDANPVPQSAPPQSTVSPPAAATRLDPDLVPVDTPGRLTDRAPLSRTSGVGQWLKSLAALLIAVLAILTVAGVGAWQSHQGRVAAEHQRLRERLQLTSRVASYAQGITNVNRLIAPVNAAPWALDGSLVDALVLRGVLASALGGDGTIAALFRTDGAVLARSGSTLPPGISVGSDPWRAALSAVVGYVPFLTWNGRPYTSSAVPILRHNRVVAVLIIAQEPVNSAPEQMLKVLGSLGFGDGGISSLDLAGVATHSWNPALIGHQLVPESAIVDLPATTQARPVAGLPRTTTLAALVPAPFPSYRKVIIFQQPTDVFYGDLRSGQGMRDLALLAVVVVAIGMLGLSRWQREKVIRRSGARLDALLRHAHDIVLVNGDQGLSFVSTAITGLLGHDPHEWLGRDLASLLHPDDRPAVERYVDGPDGEDQTLHNIRLVHADGSYRWFDLQAVGLRDLPAVRGVVVTCHEVGERKTLQDELSFRARHDALTGLPNRSVFLQHLDRLAFGAGSDGPPYVDSAGYTVLFIDLDRFKPVNDTFGHDAGDAVLRSVAHQLSRVAEQHPGATACRLGGDEFAVLIPGINAGQAARMANAILEHAQRPIIIPGLDGQAVHVGVTIGIAHSRVDTPAAAVVRHADEAMYQAKKSGRGRYAVYAD